MPLEIMTGVSQHNACLSISRGAGGADTALVAREGFSEAGTSSSLWATVRHKGLDSDNFIVTEFPF